MDIVFRRQMTWLNEEGISLYLNERASGYPLEIYKILDSTNTECKRRVIDGAPHGLTILAEEQTGGKGRLGRNFYSPAKTGIYMSILVHPAFVGNDAMLLTTALRLRFAVALKRCFTRKPRSNGSMTFISMAERSVGF